MQSAEVENLIRTAVGAGLEGILAGRRPAVDNALKAGPARVVINSSFLYREKVPTNQSDRRLMVNLRNLDDFDILVADGVAMKAETKLLRSAEQPNAGSLATAVEEELARIGDLIYFALLGKVTGLRPSAAPVKGTRVTEIRLEPGPGEVQAVSPNVFAVRGILAVEWVLDRISAAADSPLTEEERQAVAKAYMALVDGAVTAISPPDGVAGGSVLGGIVNAMTAKSGEYDAALIRLKADPDSAEALHAVLRLAYNFSTDILPLIRLIVSICDLKPLLFWCTLDSQWELHDQFTRLPWAALGRKGNLEEYAAVIASARSHAFHHVLPFEGTLEVDLSNADVRAESIRLFPLAKSGGGGVRLQDQELADLLARFARGAQRPVGQVFWERNAAVLQSAARLGKSMAVALETLYAAAHPGIISG